MFDKFTEQYQNSLKPFAALATINVDALEKLAQLQANYAIGVLRDGITLGESLTTQKDIPGILKTQKAYTEDLQERTGDTVKTIYAVVTKAQEQAGEVIKGAFEQASDTVVAARASK